ncbi:MAG: PorT family protein [Dysgonamonadaceae bacterium]|jgi:hypothetical protein|nr:PorT family protein [Dysgonamonadaceae bacterium]
MKKIILLLAFMLSLQLSYGWDGDNRENGNPDLILESRHELTGWMGGGYSSLLNKPATGDRKAGLGINAGIGYTYLFNPKWGFATGLELATYNVKTSLLKHFDTYPAVDDEDQYNQMKLLVDINSLKETQRAYYINIPLMLQYQGHGNPGNKFYAALGAKIGIPVRCNYRTTGDFLTKGKYAFTGSIFEDMPEHGFGRYDDLKADGKLKLKLNFQLSAEAGYKWKLGDDWYLYSGLYCEYGLNDIRKTRNSPSHVLEYNRNNPVKYTVNSIAESHYTNEKGTNSDYMKKMNFLSFGIKLKVAFKMGRHVRP